MSLIYFSDWKYLPEIFILEIYKCLNDEEKVQMSLTCKRWGSLFNSPCLWRVRHFDLGGFELKRNLGKANKFVEQHGADVRYLTISCRHPSYDRINMFQSSVEALLSSQLRDSRLAVFEMGRLELSRFWRHEAPRDRFIDCFVMFFKKQEHLRVFNMTSAQFSVSGGIRVLDTVGSQCGSIMEELFIQDFFPSERAMLEIEAIFGREPTERPPFEIEKFQRALAHFTNLNSLSLNYYCLSDGVLETLATNLRGSLRTMKIKVCKDDPHVHRISDKTWKQMTTCCPSLSVRFWFDSVGHWSNIIPILQREIPVTGIHLWTGRHDDGGDHWRLTRTINHIAEYYRNSLESISLELDNNGEHVDDAILELVTTCKKLRDVRIYGQISVDTIKSMLELEAGKKTRLHSLSIDACDLTNLEWARILIIKDIYADIVRERGLILSIGNA